MSRKPSDTLEVGGSVDRPMKFNKRKFKFTARQRQLVQILDQQNTRIVFMSGPAGSSKTYMAVYCCLKSMEANRELDLLYVRSIAESADKGLGSLPGDLNEKFDPFLLPLEDKLFEILNFGEMKQLKENKKISAIPLNFLRGAHWEKMLVIADEAQNLSFKELTTLITRLGPNSTIIICGDPMQSDINGKSGFEKMFKLFDDEESQAKGIHCFKFTNRDIVRDPLLKFIVKKLETGK